MGTSVLGSVSLASFPELNAVRSTNIIYCTASEIGQQRVHVQQQQTVDSRLGNQNAE